MIKKLCALTMAAIMAFAAVGCSSAPDESQANTTETPAAEEQVTESKSEAVETAANETEEVVEAVEEPAVDEAELLAKEKEEKLNEAKKNVVESTADEAIEFAKNLKAGWNLGNTLDAFVAGVFNTLDTETSWGNPKTSQELIDGIANAGFTTIRVPVSWHNHLTLSEDEKHLIIDAEWLARVKEIVDYCYKDNLYVIINIHHDNIPEGKFGFRPDKDNAEQSIWYAREIWNQVADYFKDYDEHLIFEGLNEPRLTGDAAHEWSYENDNHIYNTSAEIINQMNQEFVDAVRASGGNNVNRYLLVTSYCATLKAAKGLKYAFPEDIASYKLMLSFHAYSPYDFALNPDLSLNTFDKESGEKEYSAMVTTVNKYFVEKGIPCVLTEYGAQEKGGNLADRVVFYETYCKAMADAGIPCVVWDNGIISGDGERFALIDRSNNEIVYPEITKAIVDSYK